MSIAAVADGMTVEVRDSGIHGKGVFAAMGIPADTMIGRYEGPRTATDGPHVLWVVEDDGEEYGIDGRNDLRYVNHAPDANAAFFGDELWSLRDIGAGEEVTHCYGDDWCAEALAW